MDNLVIGGEVISRGENRIIDLQLPPLTTHTALSMPIHVIRGRKPGPRLLVCAAIHGDEINGIEIIRRILGRKSWSGMQGDLIAIPIVNMYGFIHQTRYLPDRRDLNRCFPGTEKGSMAGRLAHIFLNEVVAKCTHGIDLPQVRACLDDPETTRIAHAFPVPVLLDASLRPGTIREAAGQKDIPWLVYEAGEALRFDEVAIRAGKRGILQVMRELGMLKKRKPKKVYEPQVASKSYWVRASKSGIFRSLLPMGAHVAKGDLLGVIDDPYGGNEDHMYAPTSGIIIGKTNLPLVYEGDAITHIARFKSLDDAADSVEIFHSEFDADDNIAFEEKIDDSPIL